MIKLIHKLSGLFYKLHRFFYDRARTRQYPDLPLSERNKITWYKDNKEKTLRYNYPLTQRSIVIDVGGYEGDFVAEIFARYQSKIYVFEPVKRYVDHMQERFKQNSSVEIVPEGLGAKNEVITIHVMDEASSYERKESIHKKGEEEEIKIRGVVDFFKSNKIEIVDLIKINIEGAEYDLLDAMISNGYIPKCKNIQVQFHDFYPDYENRYKKIRNAFELTHELTYSYPFVWENWKLK